MCVGVHAHAHRPGCLGVSLNPELRPLLVLPCNPTERHHTHGHTLMIIALYGICFLASRHEPSSTLMFDGQADFL